MAKKLRDAQLKRIRHTFQKNEIVKLYRKDVGLPEFPVGCRFIVKEAPTPAAFINVGIIGSNMVRTLWFRVCCLAHVKP